jgi:hypothetical protein
MPSAVRKNMSFGEPHHWTSVRLALLTAYFVQFIKYYKGDEIK